ncbi:MAG TPA: hypothetical protein VEA18_00050 [Candidatus Kapabacteria bacterium]|nr:hypothetical protein [Candidatus Kapabacteria bacterium]
MRRTLLSFGMLGIALLFGGASCLSLNSGSQTNAGPAGVFVSVDSGENWQQVSLLPEAEGVSTLSDVSVYRLVEDPQDTNAVYWLSREHGMFFTYNDGRSWQRPAPPLNTGFVYSLAIHPKDKCTIYATNGRLLFKSEDCSRSWKEMYRESQSERVMAITFNPFSPHQLFMATTGDAKGTVLQSSNGGVSWSVVRRFGARIEYMIADPYHEKTVYVATRSSGLFRTKDGGETWVDLSDTMANFSDALTYRRFYIHPKKPNILYWVSTYGILVSKDGGDSWEAMDLIIPPGSANIYAFAVNPQNDNEMYFTATIGGRSTFYRSTDGGQNWNTKKLPTAQVPTAIRIHPERGEVVYIGFTIPPQE